MLRKEDASERPSGRRTGTRMPALVRSVGPRVVDYLKPGFHPDD